MAHRRFPPCCARRRPAGGFRPRTYRPRIYRPGASDMARDGYKIFDSDTHVGPYVEIIDKYFTADMRKRLEGWEQYKATRKNTGHITYNKGQRSYRRRLHTAGPEDQAGKGYMAGFTGAHRKAPSPQVDADPAARIGDMDLE